jgi:hypothetical protein
LPREGCARVVACCTVRCSRHRRLFRSCGISNGLADFIRYLARHSLCKWLWRSRVDFDVSWLNFARTLICGTWFSKKQEISTHPHHLGNTEQMIMFHHSSQYYLSTFQHHHVA